MSRYNQPAETTPDEIAAFANSLRTIAASFDQQAEFVKANDLGIVMVPKWTTAKDALTGLASFAAGIQDAVVKAKVMNSVDEKIRKGKEPEPEKPSKNKIKRDDKPR